MKKLLVVLLSVLLVVSMVGCSSNKGGSDSDVKTYKVGICNYVDDASLNQIVENITNTLEKLGKENNVVYEIKYENCNADMNVLAQIVSDFISDKVDLMVGVATPVAMVMQSATEENNIPVIFAAVSDPLAVGLVDTLENPGKNITGTSDFLDTVSVLNLVLAGDPDITSVGLLYDQGQDSSTTAIATAKQFLAEKNITVVEKTGTNVTEIGLAAQALVDAGVKAIFTPSDNTVMTAELSIYEDLAKAGVKHYAGADSFALNGAFTGYGVDYANLGVETAVMVNKVLVEGADISTLSVKTFDNGIATVNTDICDALGLSYDDVANTFAPFCTKVQPITTAESFE